MKAVDRYLLRHIRLPFVSAVGLVVVLVFLVQMQRMAGAALGMGLTAIDVFVIVSAALPPFLVLALPLAYLASVLIALGRLSIDLELTALLAAGVSPARIARVPLLLGLVVSLVGLPVAHYLGPLGLDLLYDRLTAVGLRNVSEAIRPGVFSTHLDGLTLYAEERRENEFFEMLVVDERDPKTSVLITAERGRLLPKGAYGLELSLETGEIHQGGLEPIYQRTRFEVARIGIDVRGQLASRTRFVSPSQRMRSEEMWRVAQGARPGDVNAARVARDLYRRFAHPAMALIFGLVAASICLTGGARARVRNVLLGLLAVVFYYLLNRLGDLMVARSVGGPVLAVFGPNLLLLAVAVFGLARAGRPR